MTDGASLDAGATTGGDGGPTWTAGRIAATVVIIATFVFWIWAFSPWAPRGNPDRLDDRTFAESAETACAAAQAAIDALPSPRQAEDFDERADQVALGTGHVTQMLSRLASAQAEMSDPDERELVSRWLADYDVYVDDRVRHETKLRQATADIPDRELRFLVTEVDGGAVTQRIDGFARVNDMDSCQIPGDV